MPNVGDQITPTIRLERQLGSGGMGSVWIAEHEALRTQVVVKFMHEKMAENDQHLLRFSREAAAGANVKSPHVVQVFDHGITASGAPFIVMELLEGSDLKAYRSGRRMSLLEVESVVSQVCKALAKAHEVGIIHRDIKPQNIFLTPMGAGEVFVKVLDFGIAKSIEPKYGLSDNDTKTGTMMGTPSYMSPAQMVGAKNLDYAADLWALGVVAFEALTGERPFEGETVGGLAIAICSGPVPVPSRINTDLTPEVDRWFARACARDKADRFSSAHEMANELRMVAAVPLSTPWLPGEGGALHSRPFPNSTPAPQAPEDRAPLPSVTVQFPTLGMTTRTPVATGHSVPDGRSRPAPSTSRRTAALALALLGAFLAGGAGFARILRKTSAPDPALTASASQIAARPPDAPSPPPASAAAPDPVAVTAPAPSPSPAPGPARVDEAGSAVRTVTSTTRAALGPAARPGSAGGGAQATPRAAPVPKATCNPPYVIDSMGDRQYKPECL